MPSKRDAGAETSVEAGVNRGRNVNAQGSAKRILVIEDERNSREGLRQWLTAKGYRVGTARDGWEALRAIKAQAWDLAIVDLDLPPVMDLALTGWDLVRILRAYDQRVAVLVVSAAEESAVRAKLTELRVNGFLGKPIRLGQLCEAIRSLGDPPVPVGIPGDAARS